MTDQPPAADERDLISLMRAPQRTLNHDFERRCRIEGLRVHVDEAIDADGMQRVTVHLLSSSQPGLHRVVLVPAACVQGLFEKDTLRRIRRAAREAGIDGTEHELFSYESTYGTALEDRPKEGGGRFAFGSAYRIVEVGLVNDDFFQGWITLRLERITDTTGDET